MNIKAAWRALWKGCYSWEEPKITCEPRPVFEKPKVVKEYIYIPVSGPIEFFYAATDPAAGYGSSGSTPATWHNKLFISPEAAFAVTNGHSHISQVRGFKDEAGEVYIFGYVTKGEFFKE